MSTPEERLNIAIQKRLCLNCLSRYHRKKDCQSTTRCHVPGCKQSHHTSLHGGSSAADSFGCRERIISIPYNNAVILTKTFSYNSISCLFSHYVFPHFFSYYFLFMLILTLDLFVSFWFHFLNRSHQCCERFRLWRTISVVSLIWMAVSAITLSHTIFTLWMAISAVTLWTTISVVTLNLKSTISVGTLNFKSTISVGTLNLKSTTIVGTLNFQSTISVGTLAYYRPAVSFA